MLTTFFLILGLIGLIIGAHLIIKGSLNIANHYKISQLFIGLTILAIGTDLPELFVIITGAVKKLGGVETSGLIVGQTIGSCMGQIALTLGIMGLISFLTVTKRELLRDGLFMIGSVLLLFFISFNGNISRVEGIIFLIIYIFYFFNLQREEKVFAKIKKAPRIRLGWSILSITAGLFLLIYSSDLVVENAVKLAEILNVSQSLVGVLIIGLGTSLPELALTISATVKKAYGLSVGNLIGSNIFDILFALGIGSTISGFSVNPELLRFDIPILFITSIIVVLLFRSGFRIKKTEAVLLLAVYVVYVGLKLFGY